jgi:1,4-alpha-glucan branching enzyme
MEIDLLKRRETSFVLWRPAITNPPPKLVIGTFQPGTPASLKGRQEFDLSPDLEFSELWQRPASQCRLLDGTVYHYFFEVGNSNPYPGNGPARVQVTDPLATTVDWRLTFVRGIAGPGDPDHGKALESPAAVVLYKGGRLVPCDPGGQVIDFSALQDVPLEALPTNNRLVIYELPTRWIRAGSIPGGGLGAVRVCTFADVAALVSRDRAGANFRGLGVLAPGRSYLKELGVNALELLPPADSYQYLEWGYGTSNYLAPDFALGRPYGQDAPTAGTALVDLMQICHQANIRFLYDAVMAFSHNDPYAFINFHDFHVQFNATPLDPEQGARNPFGGDLIKYGYRVQGYDPIGGKHDFFYPGRQYMKLHLYHWLLNYRCDGLRLESVNNIDNYLFIQEIDAQMRLAWRDHYNGSPAADTRFITIGGSAAREHVLDGGLDAMWDFDFKYNLRNAILGHTIYGQSDFAMGIQILIDCRRRGFTDLTQAVIYVTSHDVGGGVQNQRLYSWLEANGVILKEERYKLAFACLLTAVGLPMFLAGEEFADESKLNALDDYQMQIDPVNYQRLEQDAWRRGLLSCVGRLVKLRATADALSVNDLQWIHTDLNGKRVVAWQRGRPGVDDPVVVVANFSDFASAPGTDYIVENFPSSPPGQKWWEVVSDRTEGLRAGREPLIAWGVQVYTLVTA